MRCDGRWERRDCEAESSSSSSEEEEEDNITTATSTDSEEEEEEDSSSEDDEIKSFICEININKACKGNRYGYHNNQGLHGFHKQ